MLLALPAAWLAVEFPAYRGEWRAGLAAYLVILLAATAALVCFPHRWEGRTGWLLIAMWALALRLCFLPYPVSDDMNRSLWEGGLVAAGENPYLAPALDERWQAWHDDRWQGMNHRDKTTIYPPGTLWLFAGLHVLTDSETGFKTAFLLADWAGVLVLMSLLRGAGLSIRWALLYAGHPLLLFAFAGEGHHDSTMNLALLGMFWCLQRKRLGMAWLLLGLAVQMKWMAGLALPWLWFASLRGAGDGGAAGGGALALAWVRGNRRAWGGLALFALVQAGPALPFAGGLTEMARGFMHFASEMAFNGPVHHLLRQALDNQIRLAAWICAGLFGLWMLYLLWRWRDRDEGVLLAFGGLWLLSPTIHFWYLTWLIGPMCRWFHPAWWVLWAGSGLSMVGYSVAAAGGGWVQPFWAHALQWYPFALLFVVWMVRAELGSRWRRRRGAAVDRPADIRGPRWSVVIPVLNDRAMVAANAANWAQWNRDGGEVLVVDGGSRDGSADAARGAGFRVLTAHPGRGLQIAAGVEAARGGWVLVLHADARMDPGTRERLDQLVRAHPHAVGGAVGQRFEPCQGLLWGVEWLNHAKAGLVGESFGDQGQFFRRDWLRANGGFPELPLMEDVELSARVRGSGEAPVYLWGGLTVSARSWMKEGLGRRFLRVIRLVLIYRWDRLRGRTGVRDYYTMYYGRQPAGGRDEGGAAGGRRDG